MHLSRRNVLSALGAAGASYFLPSLLQRGHGVARAQATLVPRRVLFFFTLHGMLRSRWSPVGVGGAAPQETAWELGSLHTPLQAHKARLTFLDGMTMSGLDQVAGSAADGHEAGATIALTAARRAGPRAGGGVSIDQYIARGLVAGGTVRPFESLVLGVGQPEFGDPSSTYVGSNNRVAISSDPGALFARLIPRIPAMGNPDPNAARAVARKRSVLDFAAREYDAVAREASTLDRQRLATHRDAVRDLEKRLGAAGAGPACRAPATNVGSAYLDRLDAQLRILQLAFACDLTRTATLYMDLPPPSLYGQAGISQDTFHADFIHAADRGDQGRDNAVAEFHRFISTQFARVLNTLQAITEPDGSSMLDNTVVVWCNQLGGGYDHSLDRMPFVLAGGRNSGFRTGRFLRFPNRPHNDLYAAVANMMGVTTSKFGEQSIATAPLNLS